jgi:signal transduction histidine kinase
MSKTPQTTGTRESSGDSRVLALAAHELRTPLSVVNGYARMLLEGNADPLTDRQRRMLEGSRRACGVLVRIAHELDELAALYEHGVTHARSPVAILPMCEEVLQSVALAHGSPAPFFIGNDTDRAAACVDGHAESLRQAFAALMTAKARIHGTDQLEGCAFTGDDGGAGHVIVAFGPRGLSANRERITAGRVGFDRWQGGAGLSLPIACAIIESHGGRVWSTAVERSQAATACALPIRTPDSSQ